MSRFIYYPDNDVMSFDKPLYISLHDNVFKKLNEMHKDPKQFFDAASKLEQLLFNASKLHEGEIQFLIEDVNMFCHVNQDDDGVNWLYVSSAIKRKPIHQNTMNKYGKLFYLKQGIIFHNKLHYPAAEPKYNKEYNEHLTEKLTALLNSPVVETTEFEIDALLEETLETAEQYVLMEDEIEQVKNALGASLIYDKFEKGFSGTSNQKSFYLFYVDKTKACSFDKNTYVKVLLSDGSYAFGGISDIQEDDVYRLISVGFKEFIDIKRFFPNGEIMEMHTDVLKRVRLDVVNKLRAGHNNAEVLNRVIGSADLVPLRTGADWTTLDHAISKKEYPPNESQVKAIKNAILSEDAYLVLGPPGTGKTTVILEWVNHYVQDNKRILISSQNNKAVDNVIERLDESQMEIVRIGNAEKIQSNVEHLLFDNKIESLKEKVVESLKDTIEKTTLYANRINTMLNSLSELEHTINSAEICRANLKPHYESVKEDYLVRMNKICDEVKDLKHDYHIQKLKLEKILKPSNDQNIFQRLKHKLFNGLNKQRVKKLNDQLRKTRLEINQHKDTYKVLLSSFKTFQKEPTYSSFKSQLFELGQAIENLVNDLESQSIFYEHKSENLYDQVALSYLDLKQEASKLKMFCLKEKEKSSKVLKSFEMFLEETASKNNQVISEVLLESADVVAGTCIGINTQESFKSIEFDCSIIDESGQIQVHNALVPMSRAPKVIMLGDHKQIPPVVNSDLVVRADAKGVETNLLKKSLFEVLYNRLPETHKTLLDTQYRMPAEIADLLSEYFYDGAYKSPAFKRHMPSLFTDLFDKPFVVIDTSKEKNREAVSIEDSGWINEFEAEIIIKLVGALLRGEGCRKVTCEDIGIISMYSKQVLLIQEKLVKKLDLSEKQAKDMVASVDSFQGQERQVILFSYVRSSKVSPKFKRIGFLKEMRRVNVALSRSQKMLISVGDMKFLSQCMHVEEEYTSCGEKEYGVNEKDMGDFVNMMMRHVQEDKIAHKHVEEVSILKEYVQ